LQKASVKRLASAADRYAYAMEQTYIARKLHFAETAPKKIITRSGDSSWLEAQLLNTKKKATYKCKFAGSGVETTRALQRVGRQPNNAAGPPSVLLEYSFACNLEALRS
jgi:hypothetical protein